MTDYTNASTEPEDDGLPVAARNWPDLNPAVFQGGCGQIVKRVMPYTEADPAAITATLLTAAGCMAGRSPHAVAGNDEHPARLSALICGPTATGAKGTSWSAVKAIIAVADPYFLSEHLEGGIVSGEGVIEMVRDGNGIDPDDKNFDEGVVDKRMLIIESEFASVLSKGVRQGSSLLPIMREAWDGSTLRSSARKANRLRATDPHICVIGHVTPGEFRAKLTDGEVDGGTVNRLLIVLSRRSKEFPDGGNLPDDVRDECGSILAAALAKAGGNTAVMVRTPGANKLWRRHYSRLVASKPDGWFASATARAQAQVLRLSVAYAILDSSPVIDTDHLAAALAMWEYCEASARTLFAEVGYETRLDDSEKVVAFIGAGGEVTRTDISNQLFSKHKKSYEVDAILAPLIADGRVIQESEKTGGRPKTFYTLRNKHNKRSKGSTSGNDQDFPRIVRTDAHKGSGAKPQVNGVNPLSMLSPPCAEVKPVSHGRFTADPPCFHCDKPVAGKTKDGAGRYIHLSCQQTKEKA